jgi:DNA-binding transcriptional MocR family regulator
LIGTLLLEDGLANRMIATQRAELRLRQDILRQKLADFDVQTQTYATHAWLHLPEPWRGAGFARASRSRGVGVLPADAFAVGREVLAHAVRINVGAARSQADFGRALDTLLDLLPSGHLQVAGVV